MIERAAKMADWLRGTYGFSPEMNAKCVQLLKDMAEEMEKIKAERDRYWQYIRGMGCDTCGGDCERCEVTPDGAWSGWVWDGEKEATTDDLINQLESKLAEYEKPLVPLTEEQIYNDPVWLEMRAEGVALMIADIVPSFDEPGSKAEIMLLGNARRAHLPYAHYGSSWRCWPRKPTDEERKAAKWDK